jgi:signal transduction histidine kinase
MSRVFARMPIHRKLVATALLVATTAVSMAVAGLALVDLWRFRQSAREEAQGLADILANNLSAAVAFEEPDTIARVLGTARVRPVVRYACAYLPDGSLYGDYHRVPGEPCPARRSLVSATRMAVVVTADIPTTADRLADDVRAAGTVVIVRDLSDLRTRALLSGLTATALLILTSVVAFVLASRLQRAISGPIADLAQAARRLGRDDEPELVSVVSTEDEIGQLGTAFNSMVARVQATNRTLRQSNDALRDEIEARRVMHTEREQLLEREQRASRLKDEFLATVSHELRTPLNAILGWAQILTTATPSPTTLGRGLDSIARNARAQARVVEDLIDISRIVTGKLRLQLAPLDMRTVVEAAVDVVRPAARNRGVTLVSDVPRTSCDVDGDAARLQQVVWNLLSNATKFTPSGGTVTVTVRCGDGVVTVSVRDTGSGISPEFLPFVFERFRQADGSMTREQGGLGLGLAIVKDLIELHGGSVSAASAGASTGATFTVTLPSRVMTAEAPDAPIDTLPEPSLHGVRVLAVDDNADALDLLSAVLTAAGAEVTVARDGDDAVQRWSRDPADVLLCDLAMPGVSGFDVLERIRALDAARHRHTPALAISAHASEDQQARSLEAGFLHHVTKPYRPSDLVRLVAGVVIRA